MGNGEIIDDDGSRTLSLHTGLVDEEIRLSIVCAMLQNTKLLDLTPDDFHDIARNAVRFVKGN
jgi:hypothetical protein